ncbi:hypothetical protein CQY20_18270 [Mycolicibacterium agri]|uniref:Membrane protein n=1 Tax=Mycolicibacterium agri TaxID=36811 RepID=A0A2A7MY17_MYCAG|nr:DUF2567 domain-containing protein [Mycolicibacterium agri]PEG36702.1 hypothetical protein CQY20_18270 [Mycolicibacterium agri]GFG49116.1 membrane protein [Mycolicibacterium agri]
MNGVAPPRISRERAAVTVVVGLALAGAFVGALWAWIAPPIHGVIALSRSGDRVHAYLGNEADNFFTSAFLLVGMVVAMAVVAAVLVWQWRAHRGPVLAAALAIGSAAAAGAAAGVGALIVRGRYDVIDIAGAPISPEHRVHYVTEAPPVFFAHSPLLIATTLLFPAAMAALVYALIAVSTARDDLGGWPPVEPVAPEPVTVDGALPSAP